MLYVGTSGFSYDDWKGRWYPPALPRGRMFDFYAERFNAVEINSTFYSMAGPRMMASLVRRGAGRVVFAVKMPETVTHLGELTPELARDFARAMAPAAEAGLLRAVLVQFPFRFRNTPGNRDYLERVVDAFANMPLVVEIRHASWKSEAGIDFFRRRRVSLCLMDMPRLNGLPAASLELTGPIGYLRFHGRNRRQWWRAEYPGARYDYHYPDEELAAWLEPIRRMRRQVENAFVFFNNHVNAQAPHNANTLLAMLGQPPPDPGYQDLFSSEPGPPDRSDPTDS